MILVFLKLKSVIVTIRPSLAIRQKVRQTINPNKALGLDNSSPTLVKISTKVLTMPLLHTVNNSMFKWIFPTQAKIAVASSCRPVSILTTFTKIYRKVIKDYLI